MSGVIRTGEISPSGTQSMPESTARKLANGRMSPTSPLKIFGQAKKKINSIFEEIVTYVDEGNYFLSSIKSDASSSLVTPEQCEQFSRYKEKVNAIKEILKRDRMKVAFFGRTSNGKSSVINAMLRNRILPSGIGHTTNCFLQVEGVDGYEAYLITEPDSGKKIGLESIGQLASALSKMKLDNETLIRICWPKELCHLLRDDVIFVDSPGVDVSPDLDTWIDKFCLDADVFVLVVNAESTIMQTEKNFFHRVSARLSKPNIFILNNRWDASASEQETMQEVKEQHLERDVAFLADELKVVSHQEAENRVFFVSAREALVSRVNQDRGTPTPTGQLLEGFQGRLFEFASFERKFEECISQSAVETKFALHAENGKEITRYIYKAMESICLTAVDRLMTTKKQHEDCQSQMDITSARMNELMNNMREKIERMAEEVEVKVGSALSEEIKRLPDLVDDFEVPFNPDPLVLHEYKKKLHAHIDTGLSTNLKNRCTEASRSVIEETTNEMADQLLDLIPNESYRKPVSNFRSKNFEMAYRFDCRTLCAGFMEDIDFRFSFGMNTLIKRFTGFKRSRGNVPRPLRFDPANDEAGTMSRGDEHGGSSDFFASFFLPVSTIYSGTTVGVLAIAATLGKAAGWRVLGFLGSIYGLLYLYERLSWTNAAKEKAFKRQYVDYASKKLRLIIFHIGVSCSSQVQQELSSTFNALCEQVDLTQADLMEQMKHLEKEMVRLDEASKQAICLKNKAQFADTEINSFRMQYLNQSKM